MSEKIPQTRVIALKFAPADAIYIGRAGKGEAGYFGNPYKLGDTVQGKRIETRQDCIDAFKFFYFYPRLANSLEFRARVMRLTGKQLACPGRGCGNGQPCHGDVIAEWLNFMVGAK